LLYADIWLVGVWGYRKYGVLLLVGGLATATIYLGDLSSPVDLGLTILSCVVLLLIAPLYAIVGFCILLASISGQDLTIQNCATFLIVGYVWCFTKLCGYALNDSAKNEKRAREEESRREWEEKEEKRLEADRRTLAEARKREQLRTKQFRTENSDVFAGISDLLSTCTAPAAEIMRAAGAIEGTDTMMTPEAVVWMDIGFIFVSFSKTGSHGDAYIKRLWSEVTLEIKPTGIDGVPPLSVVKNRGVKQLNMIFFLAEYDKQKGTSLSSKAASTYLSSVSAVSNHCEGSLAAKIITDAYIELLRPYTHESGGGGYAGNSNASGSKSAGKSVCEECVKGYQLLDLPFGASKDEVKQKRDALAQVLHSDHTGGMSKRTRDIAEEQLKRINVAYPHILKCRFSGIKGSEPPPAPHQSTSETTAGEKIKHQPSQASPSGESEVEKAEHRREVHSLQDVKDEIDALRKEVYAPTRQRATFLRS
jgi:hypothetical protein